MSGRTINAAHASKPGYEVALDSGVWVEEGSTIKADSVYLDRTASVWNVEYNEIAGSGIVRGEKTDSLDIPIWGAMLELWDDIVFKAGNKNIEVAFSYNLEELGPGKYKDITVGSHAVLNLAPGIYQIRNLTCWVACRPDL